MAVLNHVDAFNHTAVLEYLAVLNTKNITLLEHTTVLPN